MPGRPYFRSLVIVGMAMWEHTLDTEGSDVFTDDEGLEDWRAHVARHAWIREGAACWYLQSAASPHDTERGWRAGVLDHVSYGGPYDDYIVASVMYEDGVPGVDPNVERNQMTGANVTIAKAPSHTYTAPFTGVEPDDHLLLRPRAVSSSGVSSPPPPLPEVGHVRAWWVEVAEAERARRMPPLNYARRGGRARLPEEVQRPLAAGGNIFLDLSCLAGLGGGPPAGPPPPSPPNAPPEPLMPGFHESPESLESGGHPSGELFESGGINWPPVHIAPRVRLAAAAARDAARSAMARQSARERVSQKSH